MVGFCKNGAWIPTSLVETSGTVEFDTTAGVWVLVADSGGVYDVMNGLAPDLQVADLRLSFQGKLRPDVDTAVAEATTIEITQIIGG